MKVGIQFMASMTMMLALILPATAQISSKPIMVHYMPWFQSPYSLGNGKWGYHWTMNHFNPNVINATNGEDEVASWYYPLIGPYDSTDPAVLEYHVLLMKLSGIDGVIVDWYGPDNYYDYGVNNQRTLAIFAYAQKAGLKFSLCYEDATIRAEISGGGMNGVRVTSDNAIAHAQAEMLYAQTHFFGCTNYLQWQNHPVLLNFGPQYFVDSTNWTSIFSVLTAPNVPAFFSEDNDLPSAGEGAFDWPPMQLSRTNAESPTEPELSDTALTGYLATFDDSARAWPAYISTAFPRFHDIYGQAGRGSSYGHLDDQNGNTLRETLSRAMTNASAIIQVATWNDYGEGTVVEPTAAGGESTTEYGFTDLGIIQDFRREYLDPAFPFHTNDLSLAVRQYNLRKKYLNNVVIAAELDRVFANIISGKTAAATVLLSRIEARRPVGYDLSAERSPKQIDIGRYPAAGAQAEVPTELMTWQAEKAYAGGTNLISSTTDPAQAGSRLVKLVP
ncbi:MAG TPA: glycoside hydrolase family 71/99-like protein [Candidatus Angelobacter sp.]|nr:glycoside hydrolase family 71/99-like protein [Candidatus Angelobacter sp.]